MNINIFSATLVAALALGTVPSVRADETTYNVTWSGRNNKSWTDEGVWDTVSPSARAVVKIVDYKV